MQVERDSPFRATGATKRARLVRAACAADSSIRSGNRAKKRIGCAGTLCSGLMLRSGNRPKYEHRGAGAPCDRRRGSTWETGPVTGNARTGAPCSEVGPIALGNRSGGVGFMVQALMGCGRFCGFGKLKRRDRLHHTSDLRSDHRAVARATARWRGCSRVACPKRAVRERPPSRAYGCGIGGGHGLGDHVRGPLHSLGDWGVKRAWWNRETEPRRRASRGKPGDERGRGPTRARATEQRDVRTTNSAAGQPGDESVNTTNSSTVQKGDESVEQQTRGTGNRAKRAWTRRP